MGIYRTAMLRGMSLKIPRVNFFSNEFACTTQCAWFVNVYGIHGHENRRDDVAECDGSLRNVVVCMYVARGAVVMRRDLCISTWVCLNVVEWKKNKSTTFIRRWAKSPCMIEPNPVTTHEALVISARPCAQLAPHFFLVKVQLIINNDIWNKSTK